MAENKDPVPAMSGNWLWSLARCDQMKLPRLGFHGLMEKAMQESFLRSIYGLLLHRKRYRPMRNELPEC